MAIGQSDFGKTFTLALAQGQRAQVTLPANGVHWSGPTGGAGIVTVVAEPTPSTEVAWALIPVARGSASLSWTGAPVCSPGTACPMFIEEFSVTIVVA